MGDESFISSLSEEKPVGGSGDPAPASAPAGAPPSSPSAPSSSGHAGSGHAGSGGGEGAPPAWAANLSEDVRAYVENKGWKEPGDLLASYRQLEEFLGADKAGRGLVLPRDEKDQEALDKIYTALGRPEKAEGYELNSLLAKEETDPAFMEAMATAMHGAGLSKNQAQKLAADYQGQINASRQAAIEAHQADVIEARRTLSPEEKENCRRGFRFMGISNEDAAAIEMYWGVKKAAQMFAKLGRALGEDSRVDGTGSDSGFAGSPQAAQQRIAELKADPAFTKRYTEGEPTAARIMDDLFMRAAEAPPAAEAGE